MDVPTALKLLYGNYDAKAGTSAAEDEVIVSVYATQAAIINGRRTWFLYTTSNRKNNDCHACAVTLGAAAFEEQAGTWVKKVDNRHLAEIGSWGTAQACKPVQWGTQAYGLIVEGGWTGQGETSSFQTLYGFENGVFRSIFNLQLSDGNGGTGDPADKVFGWEAEWSFGPPAPNGIFDLILKLKPGNTYPPGREGIPVPGVYRYNGSAYKHLEKEVVLSQG
jgi:hypothetical protein